MDLGNSLAKHLLPLSVVIGCLIGLLFPVVFCVLDYHGLTLEAGFYSQLAAHELEQMPVEAPDPSQKHSYRIFQEYSHLTLNNKISSIKVYDDRGAELDNYGYTSSEAVAVWNRWAPYGASRVSGNKHDFARVEVRLSQRSLLIKTALTALAAGCFGWLLAFCAYRYPIRIVRQMDQEVQLLIDDLKDATDESGRLRTSAQASEKRFRDLVAGLDAIVWEADPDQRRYCFVSHQAERLLGVAVEEWHRGEDFFITQVHPDDRQRVTAAYRAMLERDDSCQIEYRRCSADGSVVWLRDTFRLVQQDGTSKHLWGVMVDVTQRIRGEEALLEANQELSSTVGKLRRSNREVSALYEMGGLFQLCRSLDEVYQIVVSTSEKFFPNDSGSLFILNQADNVLEKIVEWGETPLEQCMTFQTESCLALLSGRPHMSAGDGTEFHCPNMARISGCTYLCVPLIAQGQTLGLYRQYHFAVQPETNDEGSSDISHRQRLVVAMTEHISLAIANMKLRETLHAQSIRDPLTSLFNRRYLDDAMLREIAQAERKEYPLGVMMIDIDHFKLFNDTYGHAAGDMLLVTFANEMTGFFREYDQVCRYGGEEFLCIIPDMELETVRQRAETLRKLASKLRVHHLGLSLGQVTISVGIAMYPQHGSTRDELVRAADAALYRAKHNGRNRVMVAEGGEFVKERLAG